MWFEAVFFYKPFMTPNPPPSTTTELWPGMSWLGTGTHNRWIAAHETELNWIIIGLLSLNAAKVLNVSYVVCFTDISYAHDDNLFAQE